MKKKILGWSICILLIVTTVPIVGSSKNITINPIIMSNPEKSMVGNWTEIQKLLASDGDADDYFGVSVSISGDTALIGAGYGAEYFKGAAYVFIRTGTTWTQQAKLVALDGASGDYFGWSVSLDGDTALIGAHWDSDNGNHAGSAYIFIRTGTTWTQ
jgi:hypothetical protein